MQGSSRAEARDPCLLHSRAKEGACVHGCHQLEQLLLVLMPCFVICHLLLSLTAPSFYRSATGGEGPAAAGGGAERRQGAVPAHAEHAAGPVRPLRAACAQVPGVPPAGRQG